MSFENYFPVWNDLNTAQKNLISDSLTARQVKKGTILHNGNLDCTGLLLIKSGQLRTYILSDEGREITLYRLFDMDMCLLSASCIMRSIQFEVIIEEIAEERPDIKVGQINVDEQPELAGKFGIMTIPTLVVMKNGEIVKQASGARSKNAILEMLPTWGGRK